MLVNIYIFKFKEKLKFNVHQIFMYNGMLILLLTTVIQSL